MASRSELAGALGALVRLISHADNFAVVRAGSTYRNAKAVFESARKGNVAPLPWTPFEQFGHGTPSAAQVASLAAKDGVSVEDMQARFEQMARDEVLWANSRYQVAIREIGDSTVHLSIKRLDQETIHDWRDLQRIKNELVGPECEAIELYPAQSRLVDTSNQYHLWASTDPTFRFPLGFEESMVTDDTGAHHQRPFEA